MHGLSLVASSGAYSSLQCLGSSLQRLLLLWSAGSRHMGAVVAARGFSSVDSVVVAQGLSCSSACGIFPGQGWSLCPLHWQADSYPLCHQGSPPLPFSVFILCFELPRDISSAFCPLILQGFLVSHFPHSFHLLTIRQMHPQFLEFCSASY